MGDAGKNTTNTITMITNPKTKRMGGSMMTMVTRGINKRRTLRKVWTPRNLELRRRVLSLLI
jgi:hypothetical protein